MNMQPVSSSNIEAIGHEGDKLRVRFKPNKAGESKVFDYAGVSAEKFAEMMAAESVGSFFAREIKGTFDAVQVDAPAPQGITVKVL